MVGQESAGYPRYSSIWIVDQFADLNFEFLSLSCEQKSGFAKISWNSFQFVSHWNNRICRTCSLFHCCSLLILFWCSQLLSCRLGCFLNFWRSSGHPDCGFGCLRSCSFFGGQLCSVFIAYYVFSYLLRWGYGLCFRSSKFSIVIYFYVETPSNHLISFESFPGSIFCLPCLASVPRFYSPKYLTVG